MGKLAVALLGTIPFSVPDGTFQELTRDTSWRVDQPEPIEGIGKPVVRGRESDEMTITGVVFPGYTGKLSSVQRLRDAADKGESLMLVDGEGTLYGNWFIKRVSEKQNAHLPTGVPRRMEWSITLVVDPDDTLLTI